MLHSLYECYCYSPRKCPIDVDTQHHMNSYTQLVNIIEDLENNGVTPKLTKLPTRKVRGTGWVKGNGPTPNVGLHNINTKAGYNTHGNKCGKVG